MAQGIWGTTRGRAEAETHSEGDRRERHTGRVYTNDLSPKGGEEIRGAPLAYTPHLVGQVLQCLDKTLERFVACNIHS